MMRQKQMMGNVWNGKWMYLGVSLCIQEIVILSIMQKQKLSSGSTNDFNSESVLDIEYCSLQSEMILEKPLPHETSQTSQTSQSSQILQASLNYIVSECEKSMQRSFQKKSLFYVDISNIDKKMQSSFLSELDFTFLNLSAKDASMRKQQLQNLAAQMMSMFQGKEKRNEMLKEQNDKLRKRLGDIDMSFLEEVDETLNYSLNKESLFKNCMQEQEKYRKCKQKFVKDRQQLRNAKKI